jgi:hypothetical protein
MPVSAPSEPVIPVNIAAINTSSKSVNKIIVYYTDNTFQEFESKMNS